MVVRFACVRVRSGLIVCACVVGALPLSGCGADGAARAVGSADGAPSDRLVFLPAPTLRRLHDLGEVYPHQSADYARRDALLGVR